MTTPSCVLITGPTSGIGFECARQLGLMESIRMILLGCRNYDKAQATKARLEEITGRCDIFEIVMMDVSNVDSVLNSVKEIKKILLSSTSLSSLSSSERNEGRIDGVLLNAGGAGWPEPQALTQDGVTSSMATNTLGCVVLIDELIKADLLISGGTSPRAAMTSVVYSGSESARGVPEMSLPPPKLETGSIDEFVSICDGSFFPQDAAETQDQQQIAKSLGSHAKFVGTLWMSSMARKYSGKIRFVTMSPGATFGTSVANGIPWYKYAYVRTIVYLLSFMGLSHSPQVGAKRYVDALIDHDKYQSGVFYGSKVGLSGDVSDQSEFSDYFQNETYQDNASIALHKFIK